MRCLTCGRRIQPQMKECPNCGAMVPGVATPAKAAGQGQGDWESILEPRASAPPRFDEVEQASPAAGAAPDPALAGEDHADDAEPVAIPRWQRYVWPAIIILWVIFRVLWQAIERFFRE